MCLLTWVRINNQNIIFALFFDCEMAMSLTTTRMLTIYIRHLIIFLQSSVHVHILLTLTLGFISTTNGFFIDGKKRWMDTEQSSLVALYDQYLF